MAQTAKVMKIGPDLAAELLENTTLQRPLNQAHVNYLADQMRRGLFKLNGEPIILNGKKVLDGQHRLWAVMESRCTPEFWTIDGVPDHCFDTIGTGKTRSKADVLGIEVGRDELSVRDRRTIAAAIVIILSIDTETGRHNSRACMTISNHDTVAYLREHTDIIGDHRTLAVLGKAPTALSHLLALYHMTKQQFPKASAEFFVPLISGVNVPAGSPMLLLRRKSESGASDFVANRDRMACLFKAWNAWTAGETAMRSLRFAAGTEAFPCVRLRNDQALKRIKRA